MERVRKRQISAALTTRIGEEDVVAARNDGDTEEQEGEEEGDVNGIHG